MSKKIITLFTGYYRVDNEPHGETKFLREGTVIEIEDNLADYCLLHNVAKLVDSEPYISVEQDIVEHKVIEETVYEELINNKNSTEEASITLTEEVDEAITQLGEVDKPTKKVKAKK